MAIVASEIKQYKASTNNDAASNGGVMSTNEISSGVRNAVFPNVSESERTDGVTRWRKIFIKVANDDDLEFVNSYFHLTGISPADDYITICEGDDTDIYSDLSSPTMYGAGSLNASVASGDDEIEVVLEDSSMAIFDTSSATNTIWIGDGTNAEYFEAVSASKSDDIVTLTLAAGDTLSNGYSNSDTFVASCLSGGTIATSLDDWTESSSSGTYDETAYPLTLDNIGTVYDTWTLTFTSSSAFSVSGTLSGSVGTGNITTNFQPVNSDFTKPYFTLDSSGWGGTWALNDTITFTTYPAAQAIWIKEVVPPGATSYSNNSWVLRTVGESA